MPSSPDILSAARRRTAGDERVAREPIGAGQLELVADGLVGIPGVVPLRKSQGRGGLEGLALPGAHAVQVDATEDGRLPQVEAGWVVRPRNAGEDDAIRASPADQIRGACRRSHRAEPHELAPSLEVAEPRLSGQVIALELGRDKYQGCHKGV
jgi:hypothetical protein